jgi:hypothetical protein
LKKHHVYGSVHILCRWDGILSCHYILFTFRMFIRFSFRLGLLGFTLKWVPQQGQNLPFQCMKISHSLHRFCPVSYRVCGRAGFVALYLWQIPVHGMIRKKI